MLRGLSTVSLWADDLDAAKRWYSELLGIEPYFQVDADGEAAYIEFRIGDFQQELGFVNRRFAPAVHSNTGSAGAVVYWHVDDIEKSLEKLRSMGATEHDGITERGEGFVTASVVDPFGNILGIMYNPHYLNILDQMKGS